MVDEPKPERLSDQILDVWMKTDGAYRKAAEEIRFRRHWMEKMQGQIDDQLGMMTRSAERERLCWKEINRLRDGLKYIVEGGQDDANAHLVAEELLKESYTL